MKNRAALIMILAFIGCSSAGANQTLFASDIVFDNTGSTLTAQTVQDALVETAPDLARLLIGTWSIRTTTEHGLNESADGFDVDSVLAFESDEGEVAFNADGTYVGSEDAGIFSSICAGEPNIRDAIFEYTIIDNAILSRRCYGPNDLDPSEIRGSVAAAGVAKITENTITLDRGGSYIILTRVE